MRPDEAEREQVELLVRELMTKRPARPLSASTPAPAPVASPLAASAQEAARQAETGGTAAPARGERISVSRWSNVRILMPSARTADPDARRASRWRLNLTFLTGLRLPSRRSLGLPSLSAFRLPQLPAPSQFVRAPGPVLQVRLWVALTVVYCAALSFWPYPKTYLWGMVFYILSLGLVLVSGVWGARLSWDARLGGAHSVSLCTVAWAVTLAATETLPA